MKTDEYHQNKTGLQIFVNRASRLFNTAAVSVQSELVALNKNVRFSYWATFYGENPDAQANDIQLIEAKVINEIENKARVAKKLKEKTITDLFPVTCFSTAEALQYRETCPLWFSKPVHLSGGRGIECIPSSRLAEYCLPAHSILQAGVTDLHLLEGKKFTGRIYLLVWNKRCYIFDDGFILLHGPQFDQHSDSYDIHVNHAGYEKSDSDIEMRLMSSLKDFHIWKKSIDKQAERLAPVIESQLKASSEKHYLLLGVDLLLQNSRQTQLIEINGIPNFVHTNSINNQLNIPFFEHSIRVMTGLSAPRLRLLF